MFQAVMAALGAAGQLSSGILSAEARQSEFAEQIRGLSMKRDATIGLTKALAAASGAEMGSTSTEDYLASMTGEWNRQIRNVQYAKRMTQMTDLIGLVGGGAGAMGKFGQGMAADTAMFRAQYGYKTPMFGGMVSPVSGVGASR